MGVSRPNPGKPKPRQHRRTGGHICQRYPAGCRGCRIGGRRGPAGVVRHGRSGARRHSLQSCRHPGSQIRAGRRGHDPRRGQNPPRSQRRSAPVHQHPALFRGRRLAHARHAGAFRARPCPHVRPAQTHRRGGPHHALEFSQRDSRLEDGAGADLRQHRGDQACFGRAPERVAHRGSAARSRHSQGCRQFRRRFRRRVGFCPGERRSAQGRLLHRLLRNRQLAARRSLPPPPAHPTGNGRQESHHRARRRRFPFRRGERSQRRVLFHRPEMHRHQPRYCGRRHLRQLRRRRGGTYPQIAKLATA